MVIVITYNNNGFFLPFGYTVPTHHLIRLELYGIERLILLVKMNSSV